METPDCEYILCHIDVFVNMFFIFYLSVYITIDKLDTFLSAHRKAPDLHALCIRIPAQPDYSVMYRPDTQPTRPDMRTALQPFPAAAMHGSFVPLSTAVILLYCVPLPSLIFTRPESQVIVITFSEPGLS